MIRLCAFLLLFTGLLQLSAVEEKPAPPVWLTGEVFDEDGVLLFRTEKPVAGNSRQDVVLLGSSTAAAKTILPIYAEAAKKHMRLRLYGELKPASGFFALNKALPSIQFITWKVHAPTDPDELPANQKTVIK